MSDIAGGPTQLTPAQLAQIKATQAQQAMESGAPVNAIPSPPQTTYTNAQSIPGNPLGVASQANPQVGTAILPGGGSVEPVIIPKDQQKPTDQGQGPKGPAKIVPPTPPQVPAPIATPPQAMPAPIVAGQPKTDPIKQAASQPGFWQQLLDVAGKAGKTLFEVLGDIGAGSVHMSTPTQQRLEREQQLRLQGNELQAQKDLASANQGFNQQLQKLQMDHDTAMQSARNDIEKQQIESQYQLRRIEIENQRQMFMLNYRWNMASQTDRTGSPSQFYKFEEK